MKRLLSTVSVLAALMLFLAPSQSAAQGIRVGPHLGLNFENTDLNLGLNAQFGLPVGDRDIWGHVGLDIYPFLDGATQTRINLDGLLPFNAAKLKVYAGGGLAIALIKIDGIDESDTEMAFNLMAGVLLGDADAGIRPFVDITQTVGGFSDLGVRGGVYFAFGRTD